MTSPHDAQPAGTARPEGVFSPQYLAITLGTVAVIALVAFEALAVTTVMPTLAKDLDGLSLYALGFAAPLASGVVGMVVAGMWSDRAGPAVPLLVSLSLFAAGLLVAGLSPNMEVFVVGRVLQGLGGGAATVILYVVVGLIYPAALQASVFAAFAAAWVLPSLFGPLLAALVADAVGWRWVFLGTVGLVAVITVVLAPRMLTLPQPAEVPARAPLGRLGWAIVAAAAALGVRLLDEQDVPGFGELPVLPLACVVLAGFALTKLLPRGALRLGRGLPSVISLRGLLAGSFFVAEAYIVYVLGEKWDVSAKMAGLALTAVGLVWALASHLQARFKHLSNTTTMMIGTSAIVGGLALLAVAVTWEFSPWAAVTVYVIAGAGMGFAYPRTGVATLQASTDANRGFNSSALNAADSLGAALALALAGMVFATAERLGADPFAPVYLLSVVIAVIGLAAAWRSAPAT